MYSDFEEFNLFVYHSMVNVFLDLVIWCLGPYVDDSREYGIFRSCLAVTTRRLCGVWLAHRNGIRDAR